LLENIPGRELPKWPKVSFIMQARNEEKTMVGALETRLRDGYPNIEYIIVDDRSTDRTGQIIDEIADKDPRVRALHIKRLPDRWLGKLYAQDQGVRIATGEWLLFSDVDAFVKPGTIRKAVAYAVEQGIDHLPTFPEMYPVGFFAGMLTTIFVRLISLGGRLREVRDPHLEAAVGSGSFNLVRLSAFERPRGFGYIKLEHGDDVALGKILKESGSRQRLLNGRKYVGVSFYQSLCEAMVAVERPTFAALGNFSFPRFFFAGWVVLWLELSSYAR
jgi:cellulose synthase/poly-beta-1,6-N-acetylglucosamine synthase-like glycosyltransferase